MWQLYDYKKYHLLQLLVNRRERREKKQSSMLSFDMVSFWSCWPTAKLIDMFDLSRPSIYRTKKTKTEFNNAFEISY